MTDGGLAAGAGAGAADDRVFMRNLLDDADEVIYFKDLASRFLRVSLGCARLHRRSQAEMVGLTDADLFAPEHARAARADEERIIATGEPLVDKVERERWADRADTWVSSSKFPLRDDAGRVVGTFGISRDITRRVTAEQEVRRVEAQLRAVLDGSTDEIARYDRDLRFRYLNPAAERALGVLAADVLGRRDRDLGVPAAVLAVWEPALRRVLETGEPGEVELERTGADGRPRWCHATLSPDADADGGVVGVLASTRDITAMKAAEAALAHQATHDGLTGLPNRSLVVDRLAGALRRAERRHGVLAVFFLDVDHLKRVNDTLGHEAGDAVLVEVARRLTSAARRDDTVGRLAGDEFVVVCEDVPDHEHVHRIARRIVDALAEPMGAEVVAGAGTVQLTGSVGVAVTRDARLTPTALLARADAAMYEVKHGSRNDFRVVDADAAGPGTTDGAALDADAR